MDAAVQGINDAGLLCITCTDVAGIATSCSSLVIPSAQTTFTFLSLREDAKMVCAEGITSAPLDN